jgi:hypothetical protein
VILKSVRIRARGRGEAEIMAHLLHGEENETVRILRGTPADVHDAFLDAQRHARVYAVRQFIVAPARAATAAQMLDVVAELGAEFGFDPAVTFAVEHRKARAVPDRFPVHLHVLVPEVDPESGRVLSSAHSYARQERVAREAEYKLGEPFVRGAHHRAVLAALRVGGKTAVADALDRAFPEADAAPRPRSSYTDARHRRAARAGVDLPAAKQAVAAAWQTTATRPALEAALAVHGLLTRSGTKPGTWIVETRDGAFVGALDRLAGARKGVVTTRMEKSYEHPAAAEPRARQDGPDYPGSHVPHHSPDPRGPDAAGGARGADRRHGDGGRLGRASAGDVGGPPGGPGTAQGEPGGSARPPRQPEPGSGPARGRAGLKGPRAAAEAVRLLLSLDRPDRINFLHEAKGRAHVGAKPNAERAMDGLVEMREAARLDQVLAESGTVAEPAELVAAREANDAAARASREARSAAQAARDALAVHAEAEPAGWRRLVGWLTGANERHRASAATLAAAVAQRGTVLTRAEERARQAGTALQRATERHQAAIRSFRDGCKAAAVFAPARIAAVEAGLELLYQRPELARMGPAGLLRMGYAITDARNRAKPDLDHDPEAGVTVTGLGRP